MAKRSGLRNISLFQNLLLRHVLWPDGCDISTMGVDSQRAIRELAESKREPLVALDGNRASLTAAGSHWLRKYGGGGGGARGVRENAIPVQ